MTYIQRCSVGFGQNDFNSMEFFQKMTVLGFGMRIDLPDSELKIKEIENNKTLTKLEEIKS